MRVGKGDGGRERERIGDREREGWGRREGKEGSKDGSKE